MSRVLLVSNRLPVNVRLEHGRLVVQPSAGGLAAGLRAVHQSPDTLWVGWPGDTSRLSAAHREALAAQFDQMRIQPVALSPAEVSGFYDGFSNGVLWPLFHYRIDRVPLDGGPGLWDTYVRVNQRIADVVADIAAPGDRVWVHDYHLCLVPMMLRRRCPDLRIGFFLHVPFPTAEVYRTLAWRRAILEGMLGADLVGFHTSAYRDYFADAVKMILGVASKDERVPWGERAVRLLACPIGVDARAIAALADDPSVLAEGEAWRAPGMRLLLGVDRLDYTKGIPRRLLAFERLLEREPSWRGAVRLLQVAVPSRERVDAYREIRREVEEHVGRINGLYAQGGSMPVHYVYRALDERQVVALYRAADVMLVTPLRDGLNLVAKEFVAARTDLDGVLVLSELAGAAAELDGALRVNPYDIGRVATALARALSMSRAEKQMRMRTLCSQVRTHDVHAWSAGFLAALEQPPQVLTPAPAPPARVAEIVASVRAAPRRVLLLDYDGTLVPFAPVPGLATPDPGLVALLGRLATLPHTAVHILSGRPRADLEAWFGALPIGLHAEHGLWSRWPRHTRWQMRPLPFEDWKSAVRPALDTWVRRIPGSLVEEKTAGLAFHYRQAAILAPPEELREEVDEFARWLPVEALEGNRVLEVRARGLNKGCVVAALRERGELSGAIVALGDDVTDRDLFGALPAEAISLQVGDVPLPARYRLDGPAAARAFLEELVGSLVEPVG